MSKDKVKKVPLEITYDSVKALVDAGKNKEEIGKQFNLNAAQTVKLLKEAGLKVKIKRTVTPAFILKKPSTTNPPTKEQDEADGLVSIKHEALVEDAPEVMEDEDDQF